MSDNNYDYIFKFIFLGNSGVGKSSLLERYISDRFVPNYDITIGVEYMCKILNYNDKKVKLILWDTAGQECFQSIVKLYYKNTIAAFIVYDVTDRISFNKIKYWIRKFYEMNDNDDTILVIIGNKNDLIHSTIVKKNEGNTLAEKYDAYHYQTSAKCSNNIINIIDDTVKIVLNKISNNEIKIDNKFIQLNKNNDDHSNDYNKCCIIT